jgi:UDP-glucose 4-epimerase
LAASSDRIRADLGWTPKYTDLAGIVRDAWEVAGRS